MKSENIINFRSLCHLSEYVLLDTAQSDQPSSRSFLFANPKKYISAFDIDEVKPALEEMERLSQRYWLAGYVRYEAAFSFLPVKIKFSKAGRRPLVWFGVYDRPEIVKTVETKDHYMPLIYSKPGLSSRDYQKAIARIKNEIRKGNTYQVNYTFDVLLKSGCAMEFLYAYLRERQKTPYCALIKNKYENVLSFSPELFFQREEKKIWARPMKGTAARGRDAESDLSCKEGLRHDEKNRAENLMIVDLLRNDLGRICKPGSVCVPSMFDVETHSTVHQMTSLIQGELLDDAGYSNIFQSLFPCGSVTGAPKIKTMEIIHEAEKGQRGVYCGAIGYISPKDKAVFSVPIRILQKGHDSDTWQYRVGGGIVWDSSAKGEWAEAKLKAEFVTEQRAADFKILETMLWNGENIVYEKEHITRLKRSARALRVFVKPDDLQKTLARIKKELASKKSKMIRLLAAKDGTVSYEIFALKKGESKPVVIISDLVLDAENIFLRHKTTFRPWYQGAMKRIRKGEVWDEIFLNQSGELCEGARSNIFVEKEGVLYTPPVSCGLLPGIFRDDFLKKGKCVETILTLKDLKKADAIYCGNSVRGIQKVDVIF